MNNGNISSWLGVLTNLGVVLGLVLVAYQIAQTNDGLELDRTEISQTNTMMKANIRQDFSSNSLDLIMRFVEHPEILLKINSTTMPEWDSPEEAIVAQWMIMGVFRAWENQAWMNNEGLFEDSEWEPLVEDMKARATSPYIVEQWHQMLNRVRVCEAIPATG